MSEDSEIYDYIIVGSGTAGAVLARELSGRGKKVLILERGQYVPLKESVYTFGSIFSEIPVADKLKGAVIHAAGGSSAMYLAVMDEPPIDAYRKLGIDLQPAYDAMRLQVPLAPLPDALMSPQTHRMREAAVAAGYDWKKKLMLIDQSKCSGVYNYDAKWKALTFVDEAVRQGAVLKCGALAERVLIEDGRAVGVECRIKEGAFRSRSVRFRAARVVVCAGSLATPLLLRASGLPNVVAAGYYIDPSFTLFARVPGLRGLDSFCGTMEMTLEEGIVLKDANVHKFPFLMFMPRYMQFSRMFAYPEHLGITVMAHDEVGGGLSSDGRYHKTLDAAVFDKLARGERAARTILERAGAQDVFKAPMFIGGALGTLRVGSDVDARLETRVRDLYVCDGSLIPENGRVAPTLTLLCLAKYLADTLTQTRNAPAEAEAVSA
ncbi:FAD-dependent oxidoreductase [Tahibacter amnicola]|uniref:FAD-dependent oxidoreductase n=1 Tax=Tahibacter amnicola TaxID=2976241 RepID=A0ABY6BQ57_9GAMM|nr:FAD-dependent oxidoreductase [Tahibacter amnicola]UXI70691.1 FAD-dependent oxidoreductase [Tahibacter amnicola]